MLRGVPRPSDNICRVSELTGRRSINDALRTTLGESGWQPRAAGWFSRSAAPGWVDVPATATAVQGMPTGEAMTTLHVGARHEATEAEVAAHCNIKDSYRQRTIITSIGYLMPERRWTEWHVTPGTADHVAIQIREAVSSWADPWLDRVADDDEVVLSETVKGWLERSSIELARHLVAIRNFTDEATAAALVDEAFAALGAEGMGVAERRKMDALERFAVTHGLPLPR